MPKHVFSKSHSEIIAAAWEAIPAEQRQQMIHNIAKGLIAAHGIQEDPLGRGFEMPVDELVQAAWCLGFHYCMTAVESGALIKAGPGDPKDN
jgi:hypothetical protein